MELPHIWVEDITHNAILVDVAKWLCAQAYAELYGDGVLPYDGYDELASSDEAALRVMMAFGVFERDKPAEILGTGAIRLGSELAEADRTPLSFMKILHPKSGWNEYTTFGFDAGHIMEGTRFAYSTRCLVETPEAEQLRIDVFRRLYNAGTLIGNAHGCVDRWGILPRPVAFFVEGRCGIRLQQIRDVTLDVTNSPSLARFRQIHPEYWNRWEPALYRSVAPAPECTNPISKETIQIQRCIEMNHSL